MGRNGKFSQSLLSSTLYIYHLSALVKKGASLGDKSATGGLRLNLNLTGGGHKAPPKGGDIDHLHFGPVHSPNPIKGSGTCSSE